MDTQRDRRVKIAMLPNQDVIAILNWQKAPDGSKLLIRPLGIDLPSDAEVVGIYSDYNCAALAVVIRSDEFAPVQEGCQIERIDKPMDLERVLSSDMKEARSQSLLAISAISKPNPAIIDTIWVDHAMTLADLLARLAMRLGASDREVCEAANSQKVNQ